MSATSETIFAVSAGSLAKIFGADADANVCFICAMAASGLAGPGALLSADWPFGLHNLREPREAKQIGANIE